jgi:hypothetical protein
MQNIKNEHNFMSFTTNLHTAKKLAREGALALGLFFALFFSCSNCTSQSKPESPSEKYLLQPEERIWLREFFHDLLFEDHGAYVLYGTKPISLSCVQQPLTDAEQRELEVWLESLSLEEKSTMRTRERYDFYENSQKWEKIRNRFPIRQYLFGKFPSSKDNKTEFLLFINIEMTLKSLLRHYHDFKQELGYDFDPLEAVFEAENQDSKFWLDVLKLPVCLGILLGYGKDNACFFKWRLNPGNIKGSIGSFLTSLTTQVYEERDIPRPTSQHFLLPIFVSFGLYPDDVALFARYKAEQKKIKALYKGRDEVDVALEWLTR